MQQSALRVFDHIATIAGTLVRATRIIEVQSIAVGSNFPKNLLYLRDYDRMGFLGDSGMLCARHGLSIATFQLGYRDIGGEVVALVEIYDALQAGVLEETRSLSQVVRVDNLWFSAQD